MTPIICTGRDNCQRTFYYRDIAPYVFAVYADEEGSDDWFQISFENHGGNLQLVMMTHNNDQRYIAMGIPEAMIVEIAESTKMPIESSTNRNFPNEYQTQEAKKVWQRLGTRVSYNQNTDRFVCLP